MELNFVILVNEASCDFLASTFIPLLNTKRKRECTLLFYAKMKYSNLRKKYSKKKITELSAPLREPQARSSASNLGEVCVFLFTKGAGYKNN